MATARSRKAAETDEPKKTFEVISPLHHDQEAYAIGDQVELTEAEAAPLLGHTVKPAAEKPAT